MKYLFILLLAASSIASAQTYKCTDAQGKITFTNQTCPTSTAVQVVQPHQPPTISQQLITNQADQQYYRQQQADIAQKTRERSQISRQSTYRPTYVNRSGRDVNQCEKWKQEEKVVRNLIKPDSGRLATARSMVRRYC